MANTIFQLSTLVDITGTGVLRSIGANDVARNQQRNFETVLQVLSLRTQPSIVSWPESIILDKENVELTFGNCHAHDSQRVWTFLFTTEHPGAYAIDNAPLGALIKDFEEIPVVVGLNETAKFLLPIFYPYGAIKNIHLMVYPSL